MIYLKREGVASNLNGNGMLDFAGSGYYDINDDDALYVTYTSHDGLLHIIAKNLGNFLWGAAAASLKVPGVIARIGAHVNNFFFDSENRFHFDSKDDQHSIQSGIYWFKEHK